MHQDAVLAVSLGCHRGKLRLWLTVLRDGELLAARDLPEQIRERGLGFFECDRLHNAKTLTRLPAQGQYFCEADLRAHARGQHAQRQVKRARRCLEQISQQSFCASLATEWRTKIAHGETVGVPFKTISSPGRGGRKSPVKNSFAPAGA